MELPTKRRIGGGLLVTAGAVLGRELIFWAFGRALDAGVSLARSAAKGMTFSYPDLWINIFGVLLMAAGGWLLITGRRKSVAAAGNPSPSSDNGAIAAEVGGRLDALEKAVARFSRTLDDDGDLRGVYANRLQHGEQAYTAILAQQQLEKLGDLDDRIDKVSKSIGMDRLRICIQEQTTNIPEIMSGALNRHYGANSPSAPVG